MFGWHSSACGLQNLTLPSEVDSPTRRLQEVDSPSRRLQEVDSFTPVSSTNDLVGLEQEVQVSQLTLCHGPNLQSDTAHDLEGRE